MRFNRTLTFLPVVLLVFLPLAGCEYSDTELVLKGKLDVSGVESHIHGPVIVGVASTDDLEYIMANPQDAVEIMVPVETLDYRFNIDLADTSLKAGDEVTVFAFADNNYDGGIPMPDEGDMFGMYIDESSFATTVTLSKGSTYVEFAPDRNYYEHDASLTFEIDVENITIEDGNHIIAIAVHESGFNMGSQKIDYKKVIGLEKLTYSSSKPTYTLTILPAIYHGIAVDVNSSPMISNSINILAILDSDKNGIPDKGERYGYYRNGFSLPRTTSIENGNKELTDFPVTFFNKGYQED